MKYRLLLALVIFAWTGSDSPDLAAASNPTVKTTHPKKETLQRTTAQPATARAFFETDIHSKVAGYADLVLVDIGTRVKQGQALLEIAVPEMEIAFKRTAIDLRLLQLKEELLRASVAVAEADFNASDSENSRIQELLKRQSVTPKVADEAANRRASAEARLTAANIGSKSAGLAIESMKMSIEEMKVMMDYASIKAPFDGIITHRNVNPGDLVRNSTSLTTGSPLFTVAQTSTLRVTVPVPERDATWVDVGDLVEINFPAVPNRKFPGVVARTSGTLDPKTRSLAVEIDLQNPDDQLLPGMYGTAVITMDERTALVVPSRSIRFNQTGTEKLLYVVRGKTVTHTPVETGQDDGHQIEILSGASDSDEIVTGMLGRLKNGQSVQIANE